MSALADRVESHSGPPPRRARELDRRLTRALRGAGFRRWNAALNLLRGRQRAVIVMYHSFTPGGWAATSPDAWRSHLELLRETREVVPLGRLVAALANREATDRMVAVTIDDGYEDFFTVAYPIVRELRVPVALFVPTGFIGGLSDWYTHSRPPLRMATASMLREVDPSLVTIGSHAVHHRPLATASASTLKAELERSKRDLEDLVGAPVTLFSYPFGGHASYTTDTVRALRAARFVAAVTTRWETYSSERELLTLPRISFDDADGPEDVRAKLAGEYDWLKGRELAAHLVRSAFPRAR
jgi:peptidoglycan/xylan/chitin deacetylase (PgdA/CDA1 family)